MHKADVDKDNCNSDSRIDHEDNSNKDDYTDCNNDSASIQGIPAIIIRMKMLLVHVFLCR